jgi:hypothetical protein
LWRHIVAEARAEGASAVLLDADPNARPFYERMGCMVTGWKESSELPGRRRPQMRYAVPPG